jgi:DNA-binding transcriptional LysR family regulator
MSTANTSYLKLPKFDLRQVRAFLCLADELHFGKAAERLFTSQPALSRTIQALEDAVGTPLLERSTRKVKLTAAGDAFVAEAKQAYGHLEHAAASARDAAEGKVGRLRIGYMDFAINGRLPILLNKFRAKYPRDILDLEYNPSAKQRSALLEGRTDVGFVIGEFQSPKVSNVLIEQNDYVALLPEAHPLARAKEVRLTDLAEEPFVLGSEDAFSTFRRLFLPLCHTAGFFPNIVQQVSSTSGILGMVAAGVGVSVYAGCARNFQRLGVCVKPLADVHDTIPTFAAWTNDNRLEAVNRFKDFLIQNAQLGGMR